MPNFELIITCLSRIQAVLENSTYPKLNPLRKIIGSVTKAEHFRLLSDLDTLARFQVKDSSAFALLFTIRERSDLFQFVHSSWTVC